jgi:hypothetical protein
MDQQQALTVLVQAVQVAQSKGAYSLQEASTVAEAVSTFQPPQEDLIATTEETAEEGDSDD